MRGRCFAFRFIVHRRRIYADRGALNTIRLGTVVFQSYYGSRGANGSRDAYNSYYSPEASRYYPYDQRTPAGRASASEAGRARPIQFRIRYCLFGTGRSAPPPRPRAHGALGTERTPPRARFPGRGGGPVLRISAGSGGRLRCLWRVSTRRSTSDTHRLTIPGVRIFYTVNTRSRAMDSAMCQAATPRARSTRRRGHRVASPSDTTHCVLTI